MRTFIPVICAILWIPACSEAYITRPVTTLGHLCDSTYVTVVRVEHVSKEKGIIIYKKVKDLKGKYPRDQIKHIFDLKNTPQHKGPGDVPIRPDEKDWSYALQWAEPGKTAVIFALKYDPYGDFGHTYIDGCWYATMCPKRDWEWWYSIYTDPALLSRWHCGTAAQLVPALEAVLDNKEAIVPVLVGGTREDVRLGRAKIQGMKASLKIRDYNPKRDLVEGVVFQGKPEARMVAYHSVNLADQPLVLVVKSSELKIRNVSIGGELGGKGVLGLNFNPGVFSAYGDSIYLADIIPRGWDVQLKLLAVQDPKNRLRELYEITGAPIKGARLRLVVPTQIGDAPRLLVMDENQGDRILRVITLENFPKK